MANKRTLHIALDAICSVVLSRHSLSAFDYPDSPDSAQIKALTFGSIRYYHQLNDWVSERLNRPLKKEDLDIHCLLLLGAYQLIYTETPTHAVIFETVEVCELLDKPWAKKLVNAILRQIERDKASLVSRPHYSHPSWLVKKIKQNYPEQFEAIFRANNTQAPMSLRVHSKHTTSEYQQQLQTQDIDSRLVEVAPQGLVLSQAVSIDQLPDFNQGACYVQDLSAQLSAPLLAPTNTDRILDACAAPGGKTTHLAELAPDAQITALDSDVDRLSRVQDNAKRLNIDNIQTLVGDATQANWWDGQLFDKILLDAPCSATGVIRRHPDIKLLRKAKDMTQLVQIQRTMLDNLWPMLKPGGSLLYATCSILKAENSQQIADFLARHSDAKALPIDLDWGIDTSVGRQQLPGDEFDGFYYAKIQKAV